MAEIKIYGDIVPFKWLNDGSEYDLKDLNTALDAIDIKEGEELIVGIHTFGGCTTTAFGIFNKLLRFKAEKKIKLTTRIDGWCASSGVIVLLAGDRKIGNKFAEPFVHNAWTWMMSTNKEEAQKVMEELTRVDNQIATLYEDRTSIPKEKALELMNSEVYLTAEECLTYGFYTELENVYAAENKIVFNSLRENRKNQIKIDMNSKTQNPEKKTLLGELKTLLNTFAGKINNKIVFTAEQNELDFYDLAEDASPAVGDKATFDGKPAGENKSAGETENGTYVLASGETYKFVGEELTEIIADEEGDENDDSDLQAENETLKTEIQNLKAKNKKQKNAIETLNLKVKTAESIVEKVNALDLDIDEDEDDKDDESEKIAKPRNSKKPVTAKTPTRNLFANIK